MVAIILIIAAIAIPNLLRARIAANEASSVSSIRTINTAEITYSTSYPTVGYSVTMAALGPGGAACAAPAQANACLLDNVLASAITAGTAKSGYYYGVGGVVAGALVLTYTVGSSAARYPSSQFPSRLPSAQNRRFACISALWASCLAV